jgi:hypothetical protein
MGELPELLALAELRAPVLSALDIRGLLRLRATARGPRGWVDEHLARGLGLPPAGLGLLQLDAPQAPPDPRASSTLLVSAEAQNARGSERLPGALRELFPSCTELLQLAAQVPAEPGIDAGRRRAQWAAMVLAGEDSRTRLLREDFFPQPLRPERYAPAPPPWVSRLQLLDFSRAACTTVAEVNEVVAAAAPGLRVLRLDAAGCLTAAAMLAGRRGEPWPAGGPPQKLLLGESAYWPAVESLPRLREFSAREAFVFGTAEAAALGKACPGLRTLRISHDAISPVGWSDLLAELSALTWLDVAHSALDDQVGFGRISVP